MKFGRSDLAAVLGVGALMVLLCIPMLTLRAPMLYSDASVESIPRLFALARVVQDGALPLWDPFTFGGGRPFYTTNESGIFYPPMYPFFATADLSDVGTASVWLAYLPYLLHLLFAALGTYALLRLSVRVGVVGAAVGALAYALSPEMWMQVITPDGAHLFAYVPWILLATDRWIARPRLSIWLAGSLAVALMTSVGTVNFLARVEFFAGAIAVGLALSKVAERGWRRSLAYVPALAAMHVTGVALAAYSLGGVVEAVGWISDAWIITPEMAANIMRESSMPPVNLVTLIVPNFFGVLASAHGWGVAVEEEMTNVSALAGGPFLFLLAVVALSKFRRGLRTETTVWVRTATIAMIAALLVMMGRFTPVFGWMCVAFPWFFQFPHPIYYRFVECFALAILAGVGIDVLVRGDAPTIARCILGVACCALALAVWALVDAVFVEDAWLSGYQTLTLYGEWSWWLTRPVAGTALALVVAVVISRATPPARAKLFASFVIVEICLLGGLGLYRGMLFEQKRWPPERTVEVRDERYLTIDAHPHFELATRLESIHREEAVRFTANVSTIDNQAWTLGVRSLAGYSSKPLIPRYRDVVERYATGTPYDLHWDEPPGVLFRNMNVGYVVTYERELDLPEIARSDNLTLYDLGEAVPQAYFQPNVVAADRPQQLERLFDTDLRGVAYVLPNDADIADGLDPAERKSGPPFPVSARAVADIQRDGPNVIRLEVATDVPGLLVVPETWHEGWTAWIGSRRVRLIEVNYYQQGVVLEPGNHQIDLRFEPRSFQAGVRITLVTLGLMGVLSLLCAVQSMRRRLDEAGIGV